MRSAPSSGPPRALLVGLCCLVLLAACRFPGTVRPTVKVGLMAPFEGRYRYVGYDVIYAVRLALREVNASGGAGEYSIELVAYDDGANPVMAVDQARKLAVDPQVVAAIGHFRSETTAAAAEVYDDAGIALISPAALEPVAEPLAQTLEDRLAEYEGPMLLIADGGPVTRELLGGVGAERFAAVLLPFESNWRSIVQSIDPAVIVCQTDPVSAGEVLSVLREDGWRGDFVGGPALAAADFGQVAGRSAAGATFVTPFPFPQDVPGREAFVADYRTVASHVPPPGPLALPAYEAAHRVAGAIEASQAISDAPSRVAVAQALAALDEDEPPQLHWYRFDEAGSIRLLAGP